MKVLYAGDSPAGGPANYLLAILRFAGANTVHLHPGQVLTLKILKKKFDAFILSDYSAKQVPSESQKEILRQVQAGAGLLMVGGWGSFSGPFGGWRGTPIEKILPVRCLSKDDRVNFPGGGAIRLERQHGMFRGISFSNPPMICGFNQVQLKTNSRILLSVQRVNRKGDKLQLDKKKYPLLVVDSGKDLKVAAFTTDFAPHWCGGLVDWGKKSVKLPVTGNIRVEIGETYVRFGAGLIRWLATPPKK